MRLQRCVTAVLIIDGLRSHNMPLTRDVFQRTQVRVIELVPHTTHLHQPLDLCLFGVAKHEHRICGKIRTELQEKLSRKIERILKAWPRACHRGNVLAAWKSGGFVHGFRGGMTVRVTINPTMMAMKIASETDAPTNSRGDLSSGDNAR
jgi:hypothetical protein